MTGIDNWVCHSVHSGQTNATDVMSAERATTLCSQKSACAELATMEIRGKSTLRNLHLQPQISCSLQVCAMTHRCVSPSSHPSWPCACSYAWLHLMQP